MAAAVHEFKSALEELDRFRAVIDDFVSTDLGEIEKNRVILALDEAFVNVITHGYAQDQNKPIELKMDRKGDGFEFTLLDRAPLFNPLKAVSPDLAGHAESGKNHGLGIHLYTTIMKTTHSARPGGGNILTMFKAAT